MVNTKGAKEGLTVYELGFLILPSIPEDKVSDVTSAIRQVISKGKGAEIDAEEPFKYPLAYTMSKTVGSSRYVISEAYLGWIKFEAAAEDLSAIKTGIERINEIVRFLLIKAPRETAFTFAKMRAAAEEKESPNTEEEAQPAPAEEVVVE